jgi:hypothetical protein
VIHLVKEANAKLSWNVVIDYVNRILDMYDRNLEVAELNMEIAQVINEIVAKSRSARKGKDIDGFEPSQIELHTTAAPVESSRGKMWFVCNLHGHCVFIDLSCYTFKTEEKKRRIDDGDEMVDDHNNQGV